ncbi:hypothetical protein [Streptomyces sp. NPDC056987]|uniref:hypothetical protein n=1 Tax=Streptomyces sp. NPDC056987 TaxID=3345988 RepID=UPI0036258612
MSPGHRLLAGVLAAGALLTAGCAQSVDPIERLGRKAAQRVGPRAWQAPSIAGVSRGPGVPGVAGAPGFSGVPGITGVPGIPRVAVPEPVSRAVVVRRSCGRSAPPGRTGKWTGKRTGKRTATCRGPARPARGAAGGVPGTPTRAPRAPGAADAPDTPDTP